MSKKDYLLIANALAQSMKRHPLAEEIREYLLDSIVEALLQDNPRFSPERFKDYLK
jgi:hypothetical protein